MAAAFMACLGLAACAEQHPDAWKADKPDILRSMRQLQNGQVSLTHEIRELQQRILALEERIQKQNSRLQAQAVRLEAQTVRLEVQKAGIRKLQTRILRLSQTRRMTKRTLVKKINRIEKAIIKPLPPSPSLPAEAEKDRYTAAYLAFKSGRYDESAKVFRRLLKSYPKGKYADQAYYWLGETYYARHKPKKALAEFRIVAQHYPKSAKHAAALLRLGLIYRGLSRPDKTRAIFRRLIREHPDAVAAEQARTELKIPDTRLVR